MKNTNMSNTFGCLIGLALAAGVVFSAVEAQTPRTPNNGMTDWPMYNRDLGGTRFSPLTQINARNVARLTKAWAYKIGKVKAEGISGGAELTPIVVNGVMYIATYNRVAALEPETGKEVWSYEVKNGEPTRRGVSFWAGEASIPPRVFFTAGQR